MGGDPVELAMGVGKWQRKGLRITGSSGKCGPWKGNKKGRLSTNSASWLSDLSFIQEPDREKSTSAGIVKLTIHLYHFFVQAFKGEMGEYRVSTFSLVYSLKPSPYQRHISQIGFPGPRGW